MIAFARIDEEGVKETGGRGGEAAAAVVKGK